MYKATAGRKPVHTDLDLLNVGQRLVFTDFKEFHDKKNAIQHRQKTTKKKFTTLTEGSMWVIERIK